MRIRDSNDPMLNSYVESDGRTICVESLNCESRTSRLTVEFEDQCGEIQTVQWNIRIDRGLGCTICNEEDPDGPIRSPEQINDLVEESAKSDQLFAYPNPFLDEFTVDLSHIRGNITSIQLMDGSGSIKIQEKVKSETTRHIFNMQNFQSGVYIVVVSRKDLPPKYLKVLKTN